MEVKDIQSSVLYEKPINITNPNSEKPLTNPGKLNSITYISALKKAESTIEPSSTREVNSVKGTYAKNTTENLLSLNFSTEFPAPPPLHSDERISAHIKYFEKSPYSVEIVMQQHLSDVFISYKQKAVEKAMRKLNLETTFIEHEDMDDVKGGISSGDGLNPKEKKKKKKESSKEVDRSVHSPTFLSSDDELVIPTTSIKEGGETDDYLTKTESKSPPITAREEREFTPHLYSGRPKSRSATLFKPFGFTTTGDPVPYTPRRVHSANLGSPLENRQNTFEEYPQDPKAIDFLASDIPPVAPVVGYSPDDEIIHQAISKIPPASSSEHIQLSVGVHSQNVVKGVKGSDAMNDGGSLLLSNQNQIELRRAAFLEKTLPLLEPLQRVLESHNLKQKMQDIYDTHARKNLQYNEILSHLYQAKDIALMKDKERHNMLTNQFSSKYKDTGLPLFPHRMIVDNEHLIEHHLIPFSSVLGESEGMEEMVNIIRRNPIDQESNDDPKLFQKVEEKAMEKMFEKKMEQEYLNVHLRDVATLFKQKRTDNGLGSRWVRPGSLWNDAIVKGVLETELNDSNATKSLWKSRTKRKPTKKKLEQFSVEAYTDLMKGKLAQNRIEPLWSHDDDISLRKLHERVGFLPNPRYKLPIHLKPLSSSSKSHRKENDLKPDSPLASYYGGIITNPKRVIFTDYQPHFSYTKTVEVKNMTTLSRRFRVHPKTSSKYFKIALVKTPFENDGLVAPGMSCTYEILFHPDSLADFQATFLVDTEMKCNFNLEVVAVRPQPCLNIPDILECGVVRDNRIVTRKWTFFNTGGDARFYLMESEDSSILASSVWENLSKEEKEGKAVGSLHLGHFEVCPRFFEVKHNQAIILTVKYTAPESPAEAKEKWEWEDKISFQLACDNCHVATKELHAVVHKPFVKVMKNKSHLSLLEDSNFSNTNFDGIMNFGTDNPLVTTRKCIFIKNDTPLLIPFHWVCNDIQNKDSFTQFKNIRSWESLRILPQKGWMEPMQEMLFHFDLDRKDNRIYEVSAQFTILKEPATESNVSSSLNKKSMEDDNNAQNSKIKGSHSRFEQKLSEQSINKPNMTTTHVFKELKADETVSPISIACVAEGSPYDFNVFPPFIHIATPMSPGAVHRMPLVLYNNSFSPLFYEWYLESCYGSFASVYFDSPNGVIAEFSSTTIYVTLVAHIPGMIQGALQCLVTEKRVQAITVPFSLTVVIDRNSVVFDKNMVHFGILRVGEMKEEHIAITNTQSIPISWELNPLYRCPGSLLYSPMTPGSDNHFNYSHQQQLSLHRHFNCYECQHVPLIGCFPSEGTLAPLESTTVRVIFFAESCQHFKGILELSYVYRISQDLHLFQEKHAALALDVRAEVHEPRVKLLPSKLNVDVFLHHPTPFFVTLKNKTVLTTVFEWKEVIEEDYSIQFQPSSGMLSGNQELKVLVLVTANEISMIPGISLSCTIDCNPQNILKAIMDLKSHGLKLELDVSSLELCPSNNNVVN